MRMNAREQLEENRISGVKLSLTARQPTSSVCDSAQTTHRLKVFRREKQTLRERERMTLSVMKGRYNFSFPQNVRNRMKTGILRKEGRR